MFQSRAIIKWGEVFTAVFFLGGVALLATGSGLWQFPFNAFRLAVGVVAWVLAGASAGVAVRAKAGHRRMDKKLSKYGCQECGYQANALDMEDRPAVGCPKCGTQIYK